MGAVMDFDLWRQQLNDRDIQVRTQAFRHLLAARTLSQLHCRPQTELVNMHCHTFFSFNAYGYSPMALAWLAVERGWRAMATVDFEVLDAVDEALSACDDAGVRGAAGLETRVFVQEFLSRELNSPGEPGICYFVGVGFVRQIAPVGATQVLAEMRAGASQRNRDIAARINAYVGPAAIDYDRDVLPLAPSGNATERHMLVAYDRAARRAFPARQDLVTFWADKLGTDVTKIDAVFGPEPGPNELLRSKLMKRGGVGYVQPSPQSFPTLLQVSHMISACGALPTYAWLDGYSAGEQAIEELLQVMLANGVVGLTVIPERNWNLADPAAKAAHVRRFDATLQLAAQMDLPVFIGTEMNKAGQPMEDDFLEVEPLRPWRKAFVDGADLLYGHTVLERALGLGYQSVWAQQHLPTRRERNAFYTEVGRLVTPGKTAVNKLRANSQMDGPRAFLDAIRYST